MKRITGFVLLIIFSLLAFNYSKIKLAYIYYVSPCYYGKPVKQNHFPQVFLNINLEDYYSEIRSLAKTHFTVDTLKVVTYKSKSYPILELTKNKIAKSNTQKKLLIIAGVHGNESGGTLAIIKLLEEVNRNPNKFENWDLKILTAINPVGTLEMSRYNECGCDLNRKFESSKQKGVLAQKQIIDSYKPNVIINLHEAPSSGFLIHSNEYLKDKLLFQILAEVKEQGIILSRKDYFQRDLETPGNSKISGVLKFLNKLVQVQALGDYVSEKQIIEITTESGWNSKDKSQRVNSHVFTILSLIENYK